MPNRPLLSLWFAILPGCFVLSATALAQIQAAQPDDAGRPVFKTNARTVVVDVVVTGKNGRPVEGLRREDFLAEEDRKPQAISYFEEHSVAPPAPVELPKLPPNVFTNVPPAPPTDSVTVLLLDSLNTPIEDQSFVRAQMLKYLKALPPGRRMAIFALGMRLRYIQGFTDDASLLIAVLENKKSGASPQRSPLLRSPDDMAAEAQASDLGAEHAAAAAAFQQFQGEQADFQFGQRVGLTLEAFQQLANYLAGVPGRKNVVWFSTAFPVVVSPSPDMNDAMPRDYQDTVKKTDDLFAAADVAVYPIAAGGLAPDATYGASRQGPSSLLGDSIRRNANFATMDEIARDTGGEAIYNTNGLNEALAKVDEHGSHFYTIAYTPTNAAADGRYRKIEVKLAPSVAAGYKLAYRRGYYAASAKVIQARASRPPADPLHPSMGPGIPASTQIPFALRVQRAANPAGSGPSAGGNAKLKGPTTRYTVDFVIAARGLRLDPDPAHPGDRLGGAEAAMVLYDREGAPVNWLEKVVDLGMNATQYADVQANGVHLRLEIDAPKEAATLRAGVYDIHSQLAGTLEIPLSAVTAPASTKSP